MELTGTLINYYFHCKRQCYLFGIRLNLEDDSEIVQIGKAIHEDRRAQDNTEIAIDNIRIDKLTDEFLIELKKSDADVEAAKWQVLLYLKLLKSKGIVRKGRLEFAETNKQPKKTMIVELTPEHEAKLEQIDKQIDKLLRQDDVPQVLNDKRCKKCAYFEYCYV